MPNIVIPIKKVEIVQLPGNISCMVNIVTEWDSPMMPGSPATFTMLCPAEGAAAIVENWLLMHTSPDFKFAEHLVISQLGKKP